MAITRAAKEAQVAELSQSLQNAKLAVLTAYSGLSVQQSQELRAQIKQQNGSFRIVKNAMLVRAVAEAFDGLDISHIEGPIALAVGHDDAVMPAKEVVRYDKEHGVLRPLMAIDENGQVFDADEVQRLASLPSREELNGQLVGTLAAPLRGFMTVLNGNMRGLITVLDAAAKK